MGSKVKFFFIIILMLVFTALKYFFPMIERIGISRLYIPFGYIVIFIVTMYLMPTIKSNRDDKTKRMTVFIITALYLIIFFLLGLFATFERNIYWGQFEMALRNLWSVIPIILLLEFTRLRLISNIPKKHKWIYYSVITITFLLVRFSFVRLGENFVSLEKTTEFWFAIVFTELVIEGMRTYIAANCGRDAILINRLLIEVVFTFTPIFPHLDWFLLAMYNFISYVIFWFVINYEGISLDRDTRRSVVKKEKPYIYIILLAILILLVCFQVGMFEYKPTAVISNSMKPVFIRGDAVVVKKINKNNIHELKIDDIIEYKMGNRYVVHRIIAIDKTDEESWIFTTMGDYNNGPDALPVEESQVKGVVVFPIPLIGYPSVVFIEWFDKVTPAPVETGRD